MKSRHEFWLAVVLVFICVPLMMGAFCNKPESDSSIEKSIDEVAEEMREELAVPIYPGAVADSSDAGMSKAASVGGTMYIVTDSPDKVLAWYEQQLSGKTGYARSGSSRITYENIPGSTVEVFMMPAGPDGNGTNILISMK